MKLHVLHIFCIVSILQAFLISIFLISNKKGIKESNRILSAWLFIFAVVLTCSFMFSYGIWKYFNDYHKIIVIVSYLSLLLAPLFYFYIKSLLFRDAVFRKQNIIHILPYLLITIYTLYKFISVQRFVIWGTFIDTLNISVFLLQNLIYIILAMILLKRYGLSAHTFFQSINKYQIAWMKFLIGGYIVLWIAKLQSFFFRIISNDGSWCTYTATTYFMASFIFFNTIVFFALRKPEIFSKNRKYENSGLSDTMKMQYKEKLLRLMDTKKTYLNMTLSLNDLARELSIPSRYLSEVINEAFQKSFFDFINYYRVNESKRLFQDSDYNKFSILGIAYESGFNTKATFNSAFKKATGITPKEYRRNLIVITKNT
jgi:AraC-like DNA-binding protein